MTPQPPKAAKTTTIVAQREELWEGPLPHPATLESFRLLVPDAPERIFRQWEIEADHRRAYEAKALNGTIRRDRRAQYFAISFALGALVLTGLALWFDQPWVAAVIGSGTIASVVGAFLYQQQKAQRAKQVSPPTKR